MSIHGEEKRMYSDPRFIIMIIGMGIGVAFLFILWGLFYLVAARLRARTIRVLEQRGRAIAAEVTNIRFKALNRLGRTYGLISFTYKYEGKVYQSKQAIEELSAQALLKHAAHPGALVLPEKPRCAKLTYHERIVYDDPIIEGYMRFGILMILYPFIALGLGVVVGIVVMSIMLH